MKTTQDLRDLLDKIDSIQKAHLDKYRASVDNPSSEEIKSFEIAAFNCTVYQLGKAYDILTMAINGDWGF